MSRDFATNGTTQTARDDTPHAAKPGRSSAKSENPPRLALKPEEAAWSLGVSRDFFDEHVLPELRVVRRGRRRLVPVRELERWLEENAAGLVGR